MWASGLFLAAAILTTLGLVWLNIQFEGRSAPWATMGLLTFAFAAVIETIDRIISMTVFAWGAEQHLDVTGVTVQAFIRFDAGLGVAFFMLGFLAVALYGVAMLRRSPANQLGWLFVAGAALGIVLALVGAAIPAMVYLGTAALGVASWLSNT